MLKVECLKDLFYNTGKKISKGEVFTCQEGILLVEENRYSNILEVIDTNKCENHIIAFDQNGDWNNDLLFKEHFKLLGCL